MAKLVVLVQSDPCVYRSDTCRHGEVQYNLNVAVLDSILFRDHMGADS